jgi:hypothetical protein
MEMSLRSLLLVTEYRNVSHDIINRRKVGMNMLLINHPLFLFTKTIIVAEEYDLLVEDAAGSVREMMQQWFSTFHS